MTAMRTFVLAPMHSSVRWMLAVAALVAAAAHIPVIAPHLDEAPYMGVLFVVLTVACFALAVTVLFLDSRAVYLASGVTCGLAVVGYAATRLVTFPMLADDVGNWLEPLGVVSIVAESLVVWFALLGLRRAVPAPTRSTAP